MRQGSGYGQAGMGILDVPKGLISRLPLIGGADEPESKPAAEHEPDEPDTAEEPHLADEPEDDREPAHEEDEPDREEPDPAPDPDAPGSEAEEASG
jgi:hypothetical protein